MTDEEAGATPDAVEALAPRSRTTEDADLGAYRRPDRFPILSPRQIRRLAQDRERLVWAGAVVLAAYLVIFLVGRVRLDNLLPVDKDVFVPTLLASLYLLHLPTVLFAYRVNAPLSPSHPAAILLAGLACVPLLCLAVVLTILQESRVVLGRHGIPAGLVTVEKASLPGRDAA
ncbi:MAG TPA: hypothetical protein VGN57_07520 [Pirellulaceae bacterium]|nr:hypothetical protein [Pirellulaceae bacterium]